MSKLYQYRKVYGVNNVWTRLKPSYLTLLNIFLYAILGNNEKCDINYGNYAKIYCLSVWIQWKYAKWKCASENMRSIALRFESK